jgi:hypothetical protein
MKESLIVYVHTPFGDEILQLFTALSQGLNAIPSYHVTPTDI